MGRFDFRKLFYAQALDSEAFPKHLDGLANSEALSIRAFTFGTARDRSWLLSWEGLLSQGATVLQEGRGITLLELKYRSSVAGVQIRGKGRFFLVEFTRYPGVFVAVTIESSSLFVRALQRIVGKLRPHVVFPFMSHRRLKRLLIDYKTNFHFSDLIVTQASQRLRLPQQGTHKRVMPVVTWPGMAVEEAFDWLSANNGWFQKIQFEAKRGTVVIAKVAVGRNGTVRVNRLFAHAYHAFIEPIAKNHFENVTLFSHRGRREVPNLEVRPLLIDFERNQFDHLDENAKLIQAMRSMRKSSVSVLHGNPYIHLTVIDYVDGSTFDVWVLNERNLVVVPQMKGSVGGIKRLINHIFDTYAEGEVRDYGGAA
jgi:hypothetical protein